MKLSRLVPVLLGLAAPFVNSGCGNNKTMSEIVADLGGIPPAPPGHSLYTAKTSDAEVSAPATPLLEETRTVNGKTYSEILAGLTVPVAPPGYYSPTNKPVVLTRDEIRKLFINNDHSRTIDTYDFDKDGRYSTTEALEFYIDNSKPGKNDWRMTNYPDRNHDGKVSKDEMERVIGWFEAVSHRLPDKEREVCLDIIAELHKTLEDNDSIPTSLPVLIAKYDKDGDGKIDVKEALALYEDKTQTTLERNSEDEVTPQALRRVIDFYFEASCGLVLRTCISVTLREIQDQLEAEYHTKFGAWYSPENDLVEKDAFTSQKSRSK